MDDEAKTLLEDYEKSRDPDIADHLIESLDAARRARWEESMAQMDFTHLSRKSWTLLRRLGASQRPPRVLKTPAPANAVARHLVQIAKAPSEKSFERGIRDSWRQTKVDPSEDPVAISSDEISDALAKVWIGTAPGFDNIHPEFLKHLGPGALAWLAEFYTRILREHVIPRIWRRAKVIALEKPGKDPDLAASYRPISLLSVCYKLFERILLQRISPEVESFLSADQAGFRRGRGTCDQVVALTTYIENGFLQ